MVEFQGNGSNYVASFVTSLSIVSMLISVMGSYELRYVSLWLRCGFAGHVCMWHLFYKSMAFYHAFGVLPLGHNCVLPLHSLLFCFSLHSSHLSISGCMYQNIAYGIQHTLNTLLLMFSSIWGLGTGIFSPCGVFLRNS